MSGLPVVTIVTPSLNQGCFLEQAMLSVLQQDYPAIEYIVIDGGSSDGSVEIIRRYQERLAHWVSEPDTGQSRAINKGFIHGTGTILAWLNADDLLASSAVSIAVRFLEAEPDVGLVYGDRVEIDAKGNTIGYLRCPPHDPDMFRKDVTLPQETVSFRREVFEAAGGLDESLHFAMDLDLWCKIARVVRMRHIPAFLACFRRHKHSKSVVYDTAGDETRRRYEEERELVMQRHFSRRLPGMLERRLYRLQRKAAVLVASRTAKHRSDVAAIHSVREMAKAGADRIVPKQ
jgi:glycosyltransferase involved in cell wall biosynthesis